MNRLDGEAWGASGVDIGPPPTCRYTTVLIDFDFLRESRRALIKTRRERRASDPLEPILLRLGMAAQVQESRFPNATLSDREGYGSQVQTLALP